jgi:hypothetical protein
MDRKYQLMQDSLDGELSPEEHEELDGILKTSTEALGEMDGLKAVHKLLERPPHERAPERLAPVIMARIAEMIKAQQRLTGEAELDEMTEAIINVALATVTVATLPLLVGAGWLMLNRKSSPEALEAVLFQVSALFALVLDVMQVMLEEAQAAYSDDDPETAMVILTMIPATLLLLVREVLGIDDDTETDHNN